MQYKTLGTLCSIGLVTLATSVAGAQTTAGALQLALGTDIVTYTSENYAVPFDPGFSTEVHRGTTRWGFGSRHSVNLEGGYGLGDSLVLGGIVSLGGWSRGEERSALGVTADRGTESTFDILVAPKVDYMILPASKIRPFFGGALGIAHHSEKFETPAGAGRRTVTEGSTTGLALMARVGARFFLTPGFSIDPAFMFLWVPLAGGSYQDGDVQYDLDSVHGYTLGLTVAFSGWVGL